MNGKCNRSPGCGRALGTARPGTKSGSGDTDGVGGTRWLPKSSPKVRAAAGTVGQAALAASSLILASAWSRWQAQHGTDGTQWVFGITTWQRVALTLPQPGCEARRVSHAREQPEFGLDHGNHPQWKKVLVGARQCQWGSAGVKLHPAAPWFVLVTTPALTPWKQTSSMSPARGSSPMGDPHPPAAARNPIPMHWDARRMELHPGWLPGVALANSSQPSSSIDFTFNEWVNY